MGLLPTGCQNVVGRRPVAQLKTLAEELVQARQLCGDPDDLLHVFPVQGLVLPRHERRLPVFPDRGSVRASLRGGGPPRAPVCKSSARDGVSPRAPVRKSGGRTVCADGSARTPERSMQKWHFTNSTRFPDRCKTPRSARCGNLPFDRPKGVALLRDVVSRWSGNHGCARAFQRLRRAALSAGRARDRLFNGIPRPPMLAVGGQTTARPGRGRGNESGRGRGDRVGSAGVAATGHRGATREAGGSQGGYGGSKRGEPGGGYGGSSWGSRGEAMGGATGRSRGRAAGRAAGRATVGWSGSGSGRLGWVVQTNGGGRVGGRATVAGRWWTSCRPRRRQDPFTSNGQ